MNGGNIQQHLEPYGSPNYEKTGYCNILQIFIKHMRWTKSAIVQVIQNNTDDTIAWKIFPSTGNAVGENQLQTNWKSGLIPAKFDFNIA